jgi:hypothetical protein
MNGAPKSFSAEGTDMNIQRHRILGTVLLAATLACQPILARAEIISTEQLTAQHNTAAERARVQSFVERAGAAGKLRALGVDGALAKDRIDALSDEEVHNLASRIDALPAGGNFGSFSDEQVIVILLLVIIVIILVS